MDYNPSSVIAEAYRTLRTNIEFSNVDEDLQIIMVTSAQPGEGKSTTVANLAIAYAQTNKRILLIDADMRKPTMHKVFGLTNRVGLTSLLTGNRQIEDIPMECRVENLHILTSGPVPPNPSELLVSKKMAALLKELRSRYDIVLIDTPPVGLVSDAQILAGRSDGVVLVIDHGKVKRDLAIKAKAKLDHVKARILGVVLNNKSRKESKGYYYSYYGHSSEDSINTD